MNEKLDFVKRLKPRLPQIEKDSLYLKLLEATMTKIKASTQLLYASDWPHWDFDPPSAITTLPFLDTEAKRNILGLNAARLFGIPVKRVRPRPEAVMATRPHVS